MPGKEERTATYRIAPHLSHTPQGGWGSIWLSIVLIGAATAGRQEVLIKSYRQQLSTLLVRQRK